MVCPDCGKDLVLPCGPSDAPIFLAGEFPGIREIETGIPFKGPSGDILRAEILRANVFPYKGCRVGNLWLHAKSKECLVAWHLQQFLEELGKHQFALLMGSEFGKGVLYEGSVMDRVGLTLRVGGVACVVSVNPAGVPKKDGGVGEFREALRTFGRLVKGEIECQE